MNLSRELFSKIMARRKWLADLVISHAENESPRSEIGLVIRNYYLHTSDFQGDFELHNLKRFTVAWIRQVRKVGITPGLLLFCCKKILLERIEHRATFAVGEKTSPFVWFDFHNLQTVEVSI